MQTNTFLRPLFSIILLLGFFFSPFVIADSSKQIDGSWHGVASGYLKKNELPNSLKLLPPPPKQDSAAFALDQAVHKADFALKDSKRWQLAIKDADLQFPKAATAFSCALDVPISPKNTPHLLQLLRRTAVDADKATHSAKVHYQRIRPFMLDKETTCTPTDEPFLRKNGSYPSGHSTIGWTVALVLSEIAPKRTNDLIARGRAFGQSRLFCNAHWQSDVIEGRFLGAAVFARLNANPAFQQELKLAKQEVQNIRAQKLKPQNCAFEREALAQFPSQPWPANK